MFGGLSIFFNGLADSFSNLGNGLLDGLAYIWNAFGR
jgi:hypothetical protein